MQRSTLCGLQYKLRSIGIPVNKCAYIYGDKKLDIVNSGMPHSQLKKKSNYVVYHHVREGATVDE